MWISARTAVTLAAAALLLVMVAVAAPLMPRPNLPSLPEERAARAGDSKFGAATAALEAPERARAQRMAPASTVPPGAAHWAGSVGTGAAKVPSAEVLARLRVLLKDARTVADPRAETASPEWVVRLVRDDHRVDVMVDPAHDRLVVARDGERIGVYATTGLRREYGALGDALLVR